MKLLSKTWLLMACLFAIAGVASARVDGPAPVSFPDHPRLTVQRLADEYGLGAVTATAMGQDKDGFLWIGTQTGLYRYDGTRARKMTDVEGLIGHYVVDLVIAPDGTPWFAGNRGIAHYKHGRFEGVTIPAQAMSLGSGTQLIAVDSKEVVYALLYSHGLVRVDTKDPSRTKVFADAEGINDTVNGIARAENDSVWFTFGNRVAHLQAGSNSVEIDKEIQLSKDRVMALVWDGTGTLWLRSATKLGKLDPVAHKLVEEEIAIGPADDEEGRPVVDQRGRLLVPSSTGLWWQGENGEWQVITDKQGISSNDIGFATEDREGTLWVGGSGTGLDRLPGVRAWTDWTTQEGLPDNSTWATQRDLHGRLWVSTSSGIAVWDEGRHGWLKVPLPEAGGRMQARQIQVAKDGSVWAMTITGAVVRVNGDTFATTVYANYRGRPFRAIYASPSGEIWATSREHLVRFEATHPEKEPIDVPVAVPGAGEVQFLTFAPDGTLWAAGNGAVYRYDGKSWRMLTARDGLQGQAITSLTALSGREVWVAYNDVVEVSRILLDAGGKAQFDNRPWDWFIVGHDSKKRVWFDGTDGLAVYSPDGSIERLSHADGLLWDDVSPWTGVREEKDGSFMIATSRGLARYRPQQRTTEEKPVSAVITYAALGGMERAIQDTPKVKPADGSLTVQFTPMILGNGDRVSCRYQLKGLEKQTTETQLREVQFGGLPAGYYEFWVQCGQPGASRENGFASFKFQVLPNFWQTWWAELAGVALLLTSFWGYVFLRTRALDRRRVELEKAVAERSAELLQKNKELEEVSLTDPLTQTRNRRYFYETISKDIAQAVRSHLKTLDPTATPAPRQELIFVLVDIDRFKRVNDEMGHAAGDELLIQMAKRIHSVMRRSDDLVRWGGEEFLLVCRTTDRDNAPLLCSRVLDAVRKEPFDVGNGVEIHKTCSIGWAPFPWLKDDVNMLSIDNVIEMADRALYIAKREGRNRAYGLLPTQNVYKSEKPVTIETLRHCPPDLVQIV
ncbi:MAG TPA: diguanylate cyclase [Dongiaceae bacterium]|nr:diguanylate cyclase [Dongiaceae bacterium]